MRLAGILLGIVIGGLVASGSAQAETRTNDPIVHANSLLDILEKDSAKALADKIASALDNEDVAASLRPALAQVERRKPKFRAVALDRDYGGAIRQIIIYQYMLSEQFPFLYFRFTYKMTDTGWRMTNFQFDAEASQAFPPKYNIN